MCSGVDTILLSWVWESERYNETGASFMDSELLTHTLPRNRVHVTASLEHGQKVCSLHQ